MVSSAAQRDPPLLGAPNALDLCLPRTGDWAQRRAPDDAAAGGDGEGGHVAGAQVPHGARGPADPRPGQQSLVRLPADHRPARDHERDDGVPCAAQRGAPARDAPARALGAQPLARPAPAEPLARPAPAEPVARPAAAGVQPSAEDARGLKGAPHQQLQLLQSHSPL